LHTKLLLMMYDMYIMYIHTFIYMYVFLRFEKTLILKLLSITVMLTRTPIYIYSHFNGKTKEKLINEKIYKMK